MSEVKDTVRKTKRKPTFYANVTYMDNTTTTISFDTRAKMLELLNSDPQIKEVNAVIRGYPLAVSVQRKVVLQ